MANEEKLLNLINVIDAAKDRREWNQNWFVMDHKEADDCGTTMCAAGWQAAIDGMLLPREQWSGCTLDCTIDGESIPSYAQRVLELSDPEARYLFWNTYDNNYDNFVYRVKRVINGEIRSRDDFDELGSGDNDFGTRYPKNG